MTDREENRSLQNTARRCCLQFYNSRYCANSTNCQYDHKLRSEVDKVAYLKGTDFFYGTPRVMNKQKPCHFYKLGKCMFSDNCKFSHDLETNLGDNNEKNKVAPNAETCGSGCVNLPSTSSMASQELAVSAASAMGNSSSSENKELHTKEDDRSAMRSSKDDVCVSSHHLTPVNQRNWADAPEFVPRTTPKSYAQALGDEHFSLGTNCRKLCPYTTKEGICVNMGTCSNVHGEFCDMCQRFILHPYNEEERKKHQQECIKQHEKNMELSFAIQQSKEKSCGVCFEIIMEKANGEQRFGILPNCNHCFCLTCIRKWRQARQFENKIIRACPECRVTSDFVCPSMYWVDTKEDKEKLIDDYKKALSCKDCKYFKKGKGKCPFGNKCFYMHAGPNGSLVDVGPPPRQRRQRNVDSDMDALQVMLWDFLDERDIPWESLADDLEVLEIFFTDSEESDWSDYELFVD